MSDTRCEIGNKLKPGKLVKITGNPRFECKRCGRAAAKKKWLCKPKELPPGDK